MRRFSSGCGSVVVHTVELSNTQFFTADSFTAELSVHSQLPQESHKLRTSGALQKPSVDEAEADLQIAEPASDEVSDANLEAPYSANEGYSWAR